MWKQLERGADDLKSDSQMLRRALDILRQAEGFLFISWLLLASPLLMLSLQNGFIFLSSTELYFK